MFALSQVDGRLIRLNCNSVLNPSAVEFPEDIRVNKIDSDCSSSESSSDTDILSCAESDAEEIAADTAAMNSLVGNLHETLRLFFFLQHKELRKLL